MGVRDRKFGVEFEFYGPEVARKPFGEIGDFDCGDAVIRWYLVHNLGIRFDGSYNEGCWILESEYLKARPNRGSMELSSAILQGKKGIDTLKSVATILRDEIECVVDNHCGLHVHVDVSDLTAYEIAAIIARYVDLEDEIDMFVDKSRRKDLNRFCESPKVFLPELVWEAIAAGKRKNAKYAWVEDVTYERQSKVNVCAVGEHGTLEFRHHHGTLDPDKIEAWVKFCLNFVEQTRKELKGFHYPKRKLPKLNERYANSWLLSAQSQQYPQDISYAFPKWSKSSVKGLPPKYRKALVAA